MAPITSLIIQTLNNVLYSSVIQAKLPHFVFKPGQELTSSFFFFFLFCYYTFSAPANKNFLTSKNQILSHPAAIFMLLFNLPQGLDCSNPTHVSKSSSTASFKVTTILCTLLYSLTVPRPK